MELFGLVLMMFFVIVVLPVIAALLAPKRDLNTAAVITETKKACPPHKWHYQEVKDQDGNTLRWRIVCDVCGPMRPLDES